jgi:N-methylhydantoinase A
MRCPQLTAELLVPWLVLGRDNEPGPQSLAPLIADFHDLHRQRFSYANPDDAVEIVTLRLAASGRLGGDRLASAGPPGGVARSLGTRRVYCDGRWRDLPVHWRQGLTEPVIGPALIEEDYTTVFVGRSWSCALGEDGALIAQRTGA